ASVALGKKGKNASPRCSQFAQLQFGPHLQVGPQLQSLRSAAHLQLGAHVQGLHLQVSVIAELLCSDCGVHGIQSESRERLNVAANLDRHTAYSNLPTEQRPERGKTMAVIGKGRIVLWEGAALWMLEGEDTADLHPHAHHAIQVTFRLKGWFEISLDGEKLSGPVAAVGSDVRHSFRASGAVAFLFIAPESSVGTALGKLLFTPQPWKEITSGPLAASLEPLRQLFERGGSDEELQQLGKGIVMRLPWADSPTTLDPRVLAMIAYAQQNLEEGLTLPKAAESVALSPSRARHVFVAHTGLPFKTYVLWLRIERAVALYAEGSSLTEAAHAAGFADSAHFSRTFRRTFGLPAAGLRLDHG
ncbi:MAG: helix-turn-helix domain-containing protein, partial [Novosphingobium sp.]